VQAKEKGKNHLYRQLYEGSLNSFLDIVLTCHAAAAAAAEGTHNREREMERNKIVSSRKNKTMARRKSRRPPRNAGILW
jgi:hypothetical protein